MEIWCDASNHAVGAPLVQQKNRKLIDAIATKKPRLKVERCHRKRSTAGLKDAQYVE
ncbi:Hypothetical predicted protein [Paramuricea clavata]|uniref:Uncharacterized protein n=1 Tax=Paramuricea clavata TaxID=317549 RepID=A0A7D9M9L0_PARCT|nr:Hypothetical predicted protein [Paramuricea clavata]